MQGWYEAKTLRTESINLHIVVVSKTKTLALAEARGVWQLRMSGLEGTQQTHANKCEMQPYTIYQKWHNSSDDSYFA